LLRKTILLLTLAMGFVGAFMLTRIYKAYAQNSGHYNAYTLTIVETSISDRGPKITRTTKNAARSDGAIAEAVIDSTGRITGRHFSDPTTRAIAIVDDLAKEVSTYYMTVDKAAAMKAVAQGRVSNVCSGRLRGEQFVKREQIKGVDTFVYTVQSPNLADGGQAIFTHWSAPAFGCADMKYTARLTFPKGNDVGNMSTKDVTEISIGDPDQSLFQVSSSYNEVSPAQADYKKAAEHGKAVTPAMKASIDRREKRYWASQANKP
jgi:hypothetical protein